MLRLAILTILATIKVALTQGEDIDFNPNSLNYTCANIKNQGVCEFQKLDDSTEVIIESCPTYQSCSFQETSKGGQVKGECSLTERNPYTLFDEKALQAWRGGACKEDKDCAGSTCGSDKKCVGKKLDEDCGSTYECILGHYCTSGKCKKRLAAGSECTSRTSKSEECEHYTQCVKTAKDDPKYKCTKVLSLETDSIIYGGPNNSTHEEYKFLCKSGFLYPELDADKNTIYRCKSFANNANNAGGLPDTCNDENDSHKCTYTDSKNSLVSFTFEKSKCKTSFDQKKNTTYCPPGPLSDPGLQQFIKDLTEIIKSKPEECHYSKDTELDSLSYCREHLNNNWEFRNTLAKSTNLNYYKSKYAHRFVGADFCAADVIIKSKVNGIETDPPRPSKYMTCPAYTCKSDKDTPKGGFETCVNTTNPFNKEGSGIIVDVGKCKTGHYCNFRDNVFEPLLNYNFSLPCEEHKAEEVNRRLTAKRYPGELCYRHEDCFRPDSSQSDKREKYYYDVGHCVAGKCSGKKENQNCDEHTHCEAGLFCNNLYC
jgi:hypothetical protein